MKDQWAAKHVLGMDTRWKDAMKREQRVQSAASKEITKISAPAQKSAAASAEMTTKHSQETAQDVKEKHKSSRFKQNNAYPDYRSYENFSELPTSRINLLKRSEEPLYSHYIEISE